MSAIENPLLRDSSARIVQKEIERLEALSLGLEGQVHDLFYPDVHADDVPDGQSRASEEHSRAYAPVTEGSEDYGAWDEIHELVGDLHKALALVAIRMLPDREQAARRLQCVSDIMDALVEQRESLSGEALENKDTKPVVEVLDHLLSGVEDLMERHDFAGNISKLREPGVLRRHA